MGCGKSYTGKKLSEAKQLSYTDLDSYIESKSDKSIATIFREDGEGAFRNLETAYLKEVLQYDDLILAAGGGTPCFNNNMSFIKQTSTSVYLQADPDILFERLRSHDIQRPLLDDMDDEELRLFISSTLIERVPYYQQANYIVDAEGDTVASILKLMYDD